MWRCLLWSYLYYGFYGITQELQAVFANDIELDPLVEGEHRVVEREYKGTRRQNRL